MASRVFSAIILPNMGYKVVSVSAYYDTRRTDAINSIIRRQINEGAKVFITDGDIIDALVDHHIIPSRCPEDTALSQGLVSIPSCFKHGWDIKVSYGGGNNGYTLTPKRTKVS